MTGKGFDDQQGSIDPQTVTSGRSVMELEPTPGATYTES